MSVGVEINAGDVQPAIDTRLDVWSKADFASRLWDRDPTLWFDPPRDEIENRLGWLCPGSADGIDAINGFVAAAIDDGLTDVVLLGMGDDGTLWGGEFLLADYRGYRRVAHFQPIAMPGGTQAIREPWRNTLAHLSAALGWPQVSHDWPDLDIIRYLNHKPLKTLEAMIARGLNSPPASSAGRLFDAVAAALGVCRESASFEGQAAIELETLATPYFDAETGHGYSHRWQDKTLSWAPLWSALLQDLRDHIEPGRIAARFHHGLTVAVTTTATELTEQHRVDTVVLSGGVFQNCRLSECCSGLLRRQGLRVLSPQQIPANDGGIALGQAVIALARSNSPQSRL